MTKEKNIIEDLLEGENLPPVTDRSPSLAEILATSAQNAQNERRKFTRVNVGSKQLELKFTHGLQFAKQYIENISVGGLFIKTEVKAQMGELVEVEFSVPLKENGEFKKFKLSSKVSRVTSEGLGLEFTNVPTEIRIELEEYVRSILPEGESILPNKAKVSAVENLERRRAEKLETALKWRRRALQVTFILLLAGFNLWLLRAHLQESAHESVQYQTSIRIDGKEIPLTSIRSLHKDESGALVFELINDEKVSTSAKKIESDLPYYLQRSLNVIEATPHFHEKRQNQNAPKTTRPTYWIH